jgi:glycosyltransferase involved in cell wall biosynthesis
LKLRERFDAIEFVDSQAEGYAALTSDRVRERLHGTPMVMHAHTPMWIDERIAGADPSRFGRSIYHRWERDAVTAADGVLCTSALLAAELPARHAPTVLPYPIELSERPPQAIERRNEILLVGAVQPRKGVELWARSLSVVLARHPKARAVLIGPDTPTSPSGTSMVAFVRETLAPALRDRLDWLGPLSHQAVMDRIARASLLVVPSLFESFSFAAAEALDRGTPTVVSSCVGIAEHVEGLPTVPAGDVAALAEAQCRVLDDPAAARSAALVARESIRVRCSGAEHLRRREAFLQLLGARGCGSQTGVDTLDALDAFLADVEAREPRSSVVS